VASGKGFVSGDDGATEVEFALVAALIPRRFAASIQCDQNGPMMIDDPSILFWNAVATIGLPIEPVADR
jgi:hypothetical protein